MSEARAENQIPEELADAFWEALYLFTEWDTLGGEPFITRLRNPTLISAVCGLVEKFNNEMPEEVYLALNDQASRYGMAAPEHTYSAGARCLHELIKAQKKARCWN
jgi:hypothetical protein